MKKPQQLQLIKKDLRFFGGALLKGKRKKLRPLSSKDPIHIVMRSIYAKGNDSFLAKRNHAAIERFINTFARQFNIRVYQRAIVGNHIHLVIRSPHRNQYKAFIKALSGKIASHVMRDQSFDQFLGSKGGDGGQQAKSALRSQRKPQGFWEFRPFTRVMYWGRDFKKCCEYLRQNTLEAIGFVAYKPRINYYARWLQETVLILVRAGFRI